jgi:putative transposase
MLLVTTLITHRVRSLGYRLFWLWKIRARKARPRMPQSTIDLIRRVATDNLLWGAERILGELPKVGIHVAKRSIQKFLRRLRPKPRPSQSWATFVTMHAPDIFACGFLPVVDVFFRHLYRRVQGVQ